MSGENFHDTSEEPAEPSFLQRLGTLVTRFGLYAGYMSPHVAQVLHEEIVADRQERAIERETANGMREIEQHLEESTYHSAEPEGEA